MFSRGKSKRASASHAQDDDFDDPGPSKDPDKSLKGKSAASASPSFVIEIEKLGLAEGYTPAYNDTGEWIPPRTRDRVNASNLRRYIWSNGTITEWTSSHLPKSGVFRQYEAGSVFSRGKQDHLLVTEVDASRRDVKDSDQGMWMRLRFHHKPRQSSGGGYYTKVDFHGEKAATAAPMPDHIIPQLLPRIYDREPGNKGNAGLIGKLALLIALAALSAPIEHLNFVMLNCVKPGRWCMHGHDSGRDIHRGVVVRILNDPLNPDGSTMAALGRVENGDRGPFYGP